MSWLMLCLCQGTIQKINLPIKPENHLCKSIEDINFNIDLTFKEFDNLIKLHDLYHKPSSLL